MTKPERTAAARGDAGKAEETSKKDDGLLPHPTDTRLTQGKHSIDEAGCPGDEHQDEVGVASDHANEGRSAMPKEARIMGRRRDSSICCLAPKPTVKAPPATISARARVAQPDTEGETDRYGKNKDEIGTKGLRFPIEDEAIGEVRGGGDAGDGADISEAVSHDTRRLNDIRALPVAEAPPWPIRTDKLPPAGTSIGYKSILTSLLKHGRWRKSVQRWVRSVCLILLFGLLGADRLRGTRAA